MDNIIYFKAPDLTQELEEQPVAKTEAVPASITKKKKIKFSRRLELYQASLLQCKDDFQTQRIKDIFHLMCNYMKPKKVKNEIKAAATDIKSTK